MISIILFTSFLSNIKMVHLVLLEEKQTNKLMLRYNTNIEENISRIYEHC